MRRIVTLTLLGLLGLAAPSWAGCPLGGCCPGCQPVPCPDCPDCGCPCDHRLHLALFDNSQEYIGTLQCCNSTCCDRIKAAEKLGSRFHADFCCEHGVLEALIGALQCDSCWEVRRAAAWAIFTQDARTEDGVLALYIASKADYHYMVRSRAAEALDILTVCRASCYTELYKIGDEIVKELKKKKYKAGMDDCCGVVGEAYITGRAAYEKAAAEAAAKAAIPPPVILPPGAPIPVQPSLPPMPKVSAEVRPAFEATAVQDGLPAARPLPNAR